jgi:hypothetical protein
MKRMQNLEDLNLLKNSWIQNSECDKRALIIYINDNGNDTEIVKINHKGSLWLQNILANQLPGNSFSSQTLHQLSQQSEYQQTIQRQIPTFHWIPRMLVY